MLMKSTLRSYLGVCVDIGHTNQAFNLLLKHARPKLRSIPDVQHYNIVLKGWAQMGANSQITEARMHMIKNNIEPNNETYAYILMAYAKNPGAQAKNLKRMLETLNMRYKDMDTRKLFQAAYLGPEQRESVRKLLKKVDPKYKEVFCEEPIDYNCKLMQPLSKMAHQPNDIMTFGDLSSLPLWAENQRSVESESSIRIKSVARLMENREILDRYGKVWKRHQEIWRKSLTKALDDNLETLKEQFISADKIHLYPYLCSVDKNLLVRMMLDEVETNAVFGSYSMSTNSLHSSFGYKIMIRYLKNKSIADGSHQERQEIYDSYLKNYCTNPDLIGSINSRQYIQRKAIETGNYAIYKDKFSPTENWPQHIIASVGRFLYGIMLREIQFDPNVVRNPKRAIQPNQMVHAFYTAYFQIEGSHKIKEEFRAHQDFEKLHRKACYINLKFDYSYLPTTCPPMPWMSPSLGGYLTNKCDLVRISSPTEELTLDNQKLYPSLDSINFLSLCPWIVNKEILDIVIELFRSGGDTELQIPLDESKMQLSMPVLKEGDSKANRILYNKEKKKYDQKKREMYSLWRDCLYRLSIANHFRDRVFWLPHNMDFRGRTYPIPPHFNHLGSDLARSLLLFAKGRPLGERGLDWLKIHLINLVGKMKSASLEERLAYANSILEVEVLDSVDNPWYGRKWWTKNENPWQVLACCKEIAKAIKSKDPSEYISHFPIHQDGSCNGLQHYAALGRDPGGALAVNLVPCDKPQDVYTRVANLVEGMRKQDADKGLKVAIMLEGYIVRKVIKQTVMTVVYGVTRYGARAQIAKQLAARNFPEQEQWQAAQYLTGKTFNSIGEMFEKSKLIQDWLTRCAGIIASRYKQPVSWETPLGFPISQPYRHSTKTTLNRLLSPSIWADKPQHYDPMAQLNTSKQRTAFPPNYIHSLDSSHMMLTSLYSQRQGITFVSVHDCYWTHPSTVDLMNRICREQFVAMHSEPLLQDLSDTFIKKFGKHEVAEDVKKTSKKRLKKMKETQATKPMICAYEGERLAAIDKIHSTLKQVPEQGQLDLRVVLNSTYFFS